jgi:hypothetical protein
MKAWIALAMTGLGGAVPALAQVPPPPPPPGYRPPPRPPGG